MQDMGGAACRSLAIRSIQRQCFIAADAAAASTKAKAITMRLSRLGSSFGAVPWKARWCGPCFRPIYGGGLS